MRVIDRGRSWMARSPITKLCLENGIGRHTCKLIRNTRNDRLRMHLEEFRSAVGWPLRWPRRACSMRQNYTVCVVGLKMREGAPLNPMKKLFKKILCPVDPVDNMTSLDVTCSLAGEVDGTVCLLYVIPVVLSSAPGVNPLPNSESEAQAVLSKLGREHFNSKVRYEIFTKVGGEPAKVILQALKEVSADCVVVATHGRKGIGRVILGSVAERVVRESPCPVLTVRGTPGG